MLPESIVMDSSPLDLNSAGGNITARACCRWRHNARVAFYEDVGGARPKKALLGVIDFKDSLFRFPLDFSYNLNIIGDTGVLKFVAQEFIHLENAR